MRLFGLVNPQRLSPYEIGVVSFAFLLAATLFYLDTFTDIQSALATLYVITLLLSAETLTVKGTLLLAGVCIGLSVLSYVAGHGLEGDLAAALRLTVAIAAMIITCLLIIRNQRARLVLIKFNADLQSSEERYRTIFEQSRVALWERDYSGVRALLMKLREDGVFDLRAHARENPGLPPMPLLLNSSATSMGGIQARCAAILRRTTQLFLS
ncbi:PAS domain-containing protein [Rhizobium brockwellii]